MFTYMYIGETEKFNTTHERWCLSKEFVSIKGELKNFANLRMFETMEIIPQKR
jgi:hypothetical protein